MGVKKLADRGIWGQRWFWIRKSRRSRLLAYDREVEVLRASCASATRTSPRASSSSLRAVSTSVGGAKHLLPLLDVGPERLHLRAKLEHEGLGGPG